MDHLFETRFSELLVTYGEKIALAIICLIVGKIVINLIIGAVGRVKYFNNVDQTAKGYINSFLKIGLWVVLLTLSVKITFATLSVLHGVVKHAIFAGVYR